MHLQESDSKSDHQDEFLVQRQVQAVQVRHWEEEHNEIGDEVQGARNLIRQDLVAAVSIRNSLIPVERKGLAH